MESFDTQHLANLTLWFINKNNNFEGGSDQKFRLISRDSDSASMAVGNSLALSSDSSFLVLVGMVDDSSTNNGFIASISMFDFLI